MKKLTKKQIKLDSRDGSNNYLVKVNNVDNHKVDNCYKLVWEHYLRTVNIGNGRVALDPSGGPMIQEGTYLEEAGAVVDRIEINLGDKGYLIYFK